MAQQTKNIPWKIGPGNIVCKWDDADPSPIEIKISSDSTYTEARSRVLTFSAGSAQVTLNVNQRAYIPEPPVEVSCYSTGEWIMSGIWRMDDIWKNNVES